MMIMMRFDDNEDDDDDDATLVERLPGRVVQSASRATHAVSGPHPPRLICTNIKRAMVSTCMSIFSQTRKLSEPY